MKSTTLTEELREFVSNQAAEDAVLSMAERRYQADLVKDVLTQEVKSSKLLKELLVSYAGQVSKA